MTTSNQDSGDTVTVRRRRPSGQSDGPRERADAPRRERPGSSSGGASGGSSSGSSSSGSSSSGGSIGSFGGGGSSSSGGFGSGSSGQLPSMNLPKLSCGTGCLLLVAGIVLLIFFVIVIGPMLFGGEAEPEQSFPTPYVQPATQPTSPANQGFIQPTATRVTSAAPSATATLASTQPSTSGTGTTKGQKWLVMLYQDADDRVLEQDIYIDLNEAERIGSTDRVQIVAQMDRFKGGFNGDGNWTGTRRYFVTKDNDLSRVNSKVISEGEVNMSDPATLIDFATWAMKTYPADKYVLILSDHGMGWPGGFSDNDPPTSVHDQNIPLVAAMDNIMTLDEMDKALQQIRNRTGLDRFEVVGMDACLMSHIEVYAALAPHARYAVGSQETEPALGWAYTAFLKSLTANPDVTGAELGKSIVQTYIQDDQRIVDDQARAELLGRSSGFGGSAAQVARQMASDITLTAVDLSRLPALMTSLNDLSVALQKADQRNVARARNYAQSFTSVWGSNVPASYIDLGNFVRLLKQQSNDAALGQLADRVATSISQLVVDEKHGSNKPGANGVSIYFPNSQLYKNDVAGAQSYTQIASRFASESLWDEYLLFGYTGQTFQATSKGSAVPQRGATIGTSVSGKLTVSPVQLSATSVVPGKAITLTTTIQGPNVGYVYLFAGYLDKAANSIYVADIDYLESAETRQVQGVYYPDWGDRDSFRMQFAWEPIVYALTDGKTTAVTPLKPESYGASGEEAVYTVDGMYTIAGSGESIYARLFLSNGVLKRVYGFRNKNGSSTGAPSEITPNEGDTFTILESWLDQGAAGTPAKSVTQKGKTLTFGSQPIKWKELDAAAGEYVVGFIVQDLDGNFYQTNGKVTVR